MHLTEFPGLQQNIPLAPYTNFKIGGPARYFFVMTRTEDLPPLLQLAWEEKVSVLILGGGANMLISDKGYDGLVILNNSHNITIEGNKVLVDGGVKLMTIIQKTLEHNLVGFEYMVGIPGTIGASIRGNAGIPGWEMKDYLVSATLVSLQGEVKEVTKDYFQFAYRTSILKQTKEIVLNATLFLQSGDSAAAKQRMKEIHENRIKKQPQGKSCGSFFKNPSKEQPAGLLIDQCGLKGLQIGGAKVSDLHGNFLMNVGNATFQDFMALDEHIKKAVMEKFGIELQEEVQIINS